MDGVVHACFVRARVLDVLAQIQASPAWGGLSATDQARLVEEQQQSRQSVRDALPTIEAFAQLSALGERVVQAARGVVEG